MFKDHTPFPLRTPHFPDEPAHAFLLRTVAKNGSSRFDAVYRRAGIEAGHAINAIDIDLVAYLCRADVDPLRHATARRNEDRIDLLGQTIRHDYFGGWWRRWCPHCLAEAPYHRVWWDIVAIGTCPFHNVELVSDCGCETQILHGRHAITHCRHSHDLRKVDARQVSDADTAADRYIVGRLLGVEKWRHDLLDQAALGQAMHIMERIGRSILAEDLNIENARRRHSLPALLRAGAQALADYPTKFDAFLDLLISRREAKDLTSIVRAYGPLRHWFGSQLDGRATCPTAQALRSRIDWHANENSISPLRVIEDGKPTVGVLASELGVRLNQPMHQVHRLAEAAGVPVPPSTSKPARPIGPKAFQSIVDRLSSLQTMEQVIESLGVRRARVIELADMGLLPYVVRPWNRDGAPVGKRGDAPTLPLRERPLNTWFFEPHAVPDLLDRLQKKVRAGGGFNETDLVPFLHASTMFISTAQVMTMVLDGTLPLRGFDASAIGLPAFLIAAPEAQAIIRGERRDGHPLKAAAPLLGMTYNQLLTCMHNNLLLTTGSGSRLSVTDEGIDDFRSRYISAKEIAEILGVGSSKITIRYLREHGVEPIETEKPLGLTLYLREAAEPLARSLPPPSVFKTSRHRERYQRERGLEVAPTRKSYDTPPDWNKRSNDRSGRGR